LLDAGNTNTSFGSVEGVGGWPACDSREVELENRSARGMASVASAGSFLTLWHW